VFWATRCHAAIQPRFRASPLPRHGRSGHRQHIGYFILRKAAEVIELYDFALSRIQVRQLIERLIQQQEVTVAWFDRAEPVIDCHSECRIGSLGGSVRPRVIHEDPAHHLRSDREEVDTVLPIHALIHQPQIRLVNQRRRLKSMVVPLVPKISGRPASELLINQGQEIVLRVSVASRPRLKQAGQHAARSFSLTL
jgi:hypothetical protein